jgi:hypothetical protein
VTTIMQPQTPYYVSFLGLSSIGFILTRIIQDHARRSHEHSGDAKTANNNRWLNRSCARLARKELTKILPGLVIIGATYIYFDQSFPLDLEVQRYVGCCAIVWSCVAELLAVCSPSSSLASSSRAGGTQHYAALTRTLSAMCMMPVFYSIFYVWAVYCIWIINTGEVIIFCVAGCAAAVLGATSASKSMPKIGRSVATFFQTFAYSFIASSIGLFTARAWTLRAWVVYLETDWRAFCSGTLFVSVTLVSTVLSVGAYMVSIQSIDNKFKTSTEKCYIFCTRVPAYLLLSSISIFAWIGILISIYEYLGGAIL